MTNVGIVDRIGVSFRRAARPLALVFLLGACSLTQASTAAMTEQYEELCQQNEHSGKAAQVNLSEGIFDNGELWGPHYFGDIEKTSALAKKYYKRTQSGFSDRVRGLLFDHGFEFVEVNYNPGRYLPLERSLVRRPGLYRFFIAEIGNPNCSSFQEQSFEGYVSKLLPDACVAVESINLIKASYNISSEWKIINSTNKILIRKLEVLIFDRNKQEKIGNTSYYTIITSSISPAKSKACDQNRIEFEKLFVPHIGNESSK